MMPIYATALGIGGTLLLLSTIGGHHGGDHGAMDHSFDGHAGPPSADVAVFLLSLRFWTFALAFFGLTGVVFEGMKLVSDPRLVAGLAGGSGLVAGLGISLVLRSLKRQVVNSLPTEVGFVGLTGEVLLAVCPGDPGRIRVHSRGVDVDLPARGHDGATLPKGSKALVVDVTDGVATVAAPPESSRTEERKSA